MILRNKTFNGKGFFRKWFWYLYFEILVMLFNKVELEGCTITKFDFKSWEAKYLQFPRFTFKEYKEGRI